MLQRDSSIEAACRYAVIDITTYYDWLKKYPEFSQRMEAAKNFLAQTSRDIVAEALASGKDLPTAKWYLEKKDPNFTNKAKVEVEGEIKTKEDDELRELANLMRKNLENADDEPSETAESGNSEANS